MTITLKSQPPIETFHLAASYTIGSYILPGETMESINQLIQEPIKLSIIPCDEIIDGIKDNIYDLGLIESPLYDDELIYKEWIGDELIVCSKETLPPSLEEEALNNCKLICRRNGSLTREFISDFLSELNLSYRSFHTLSEVDNTTAIIQSIKWTKPNQENPTIAIVSNLAIEDELKYKKLYSSRIYNKAIKRKFHLIYDKKKTSDKYLTSIIENLLQIIR